MHGINHELPGALLLRLQGAVAPGFVLKVAQVVIGDGVAVVQHLLHALDALKAVGGDGGVIMQAHERDVGSHVDGDVITADSLELVQDGGGAFGDGHIGADRGHAQQVNVAGGIRLQQNEQCIGIVAKIAHVRIENNLVGFGRGHDVVVLHRRQSGLRRKSKYQDAYQSQELLHFLNPPCLIIPTRSAAHTAWPRLFAPVLRARNS